MPRIQCDICGQVFNKGKNFHAHLKRSKCTNVSVLLSVLGKKKDIEVSSPFIENDFQVDNLQDVDDHCINTEGDSRCSRSESESSFSETGFEEVLVTADGDIPLFNFDTCDSEVDGVDWDYVESHGNCGLLETLDKVDTTVGENEKDAVSSVLAEAPSEASKLRKITRDVCLHNDTDENGDNVETISDKTQTKKRRQKRKRGNGKHLVITSESSSSDEDFNPRKRARATNHARIKQKPKEKPKFQIESDSKSDSDRVNLQHNEAKHTQRPEPAAASNQTSSPEAKVNYQHIETKHSQRQEPTAASNQTSLPESEVNLQYIEQIHSQRQEPAAASKQNKLHDAKEETETFVGERELQLEFSCGICNMSFCDSSSLETHIYTHSNIADPNNEPEFICGMCSQVFNREEKLSNHMMQHMNQPLHETDNFGEMDNSKDATYICGTCKESFFDPNLLHKHMQTHLNIVTSLTKKPDEVQKHTPEKVKLDEKEISKCRNNAVNCFSASKSQMDKAKAPKLPLTVSKEKTIIQKETDTADVIGTIKPNSSVMMNENSVKAYLGKLMNITCTNRDNKNSPKTYGKIDRQIIDLSGSDTSKTHTFKTDCETGVNKTVSKTLDRDRGSKIVHSLADNVVPTSKVHTTTAGLVKDVRCDNTDERTALLPTIKLTEKIDSKKTPDCITKVTLTKLLNYKPKITFGKF